jgi:ribonuclease P protein component
MQRFQREQRLTRKTDYDKVFQHPFFKFGSQHFLVLAHLRQQGQQGRLGLVASKKHLKTSVARNRFKREARESFRIHQNQLTGCDVLVMSRPKSLDCPSLFHELATLWPKIEKRHRKLRLPDSVPNEQATSSP